MLQWPTTKTSSSVWAGRTGPHRGGAPSREVLLGLTFPGRGSSIHGSNQRPYTVKPLNPKFSRLWGSKLQAAIWGISGSLGLVSAGVVLGSGFVGSLGVCLQGYMHLMVGPLNIHSLLFSVFLGAFLFTETLISQTTCSTLLRVQGFRYT